MSAKSIQRYLFVVALTVAVGLFVIYALPVPDNPRPEAAVSPSSGEKPIVAPSDVDAITAAVSTIPLEAAAAPPDAGEQEAFSCPKPNFPVELDVAAMAEALQYSDDPEHLLMASLYGGSERSAEFIPVPAERNIDALFRGLEIQPRNELLLWNAMTLCVESGSEGLCDQYNVPELATTVLGNNATFWYRLAAIRADAEDMDGTLAALERSFGAPEYNEYFVEHVELFARGIAAFNNAPYNERVMAGFGMAAAQQSVESEIFRACQQEASASPKWLSICIALGEHMEARGRTMLSVMLGLGLQKNMYEISGDNLRAEAAERQMESRRRLIDELQEQTYENIVLFHDERVLEAFVDAWKAGGEFSAMRYLQRETKRLMNTPGYELCATH